MNKRTIVSMMMPAISSLFLTGCGSDLYMSKVDKDGKIDKLNSNERGVLVYMPVNVVEVYEFTRRVDGNGNVVASKDAEDNNKKCESTKAYKTGTRADTSNPYRIVQAGGFMSASKLSVTLQNGMLASVNADSDPSKALDSLVEVAKTALPAIAVVAAAGTASKDKTTETSPPLPACNDQLVLTKILPAPLPWTNPNLDQQ